MGYLLFQLKTHADCFEEGGGGGEREEEEGEGAALSLAGAFGALTLITVVVAICSGARFNSRRRCRRLRGRSCAPCTGGGEAAGPARRGSRPAGLARAGVRRPRAALACHTRSPLPPATCAQSC